MPRTRTRWVTGALGILVLLVASCADPSAPRRAAPVGRGAPAPLRVEQAITWYERAFRLLPDDDPNKKVAKERLDVLRSRK